MELTSSWVIGGFLELAAIRSGRRNTVTRVDSCLTYSSSHSTMPKTILFLLRMLSAWSERMYSSTICFQRRRHNHPRKKLCTCDGGGESNDKLRHQSRAARKEFLLWFYHCHCWLSSLTFFIFLISSLSSSSLSLDILRSRLYSRSCKLSTKQAP